MNLPETDDFHHLLVNDVPLIDVRAPVEFTQGAFPHACNLPLMNDAEREAVGIRYKQSGQAQAIELGHELVSGETKSQRVIDWAEFARRNPHGALYCFRGGMRSKLSQQWLYEHTGLEYPRVKGGYKALRRYLIDSLDVAVQDMDFVILGGRTGTGKTQLLNILEQKIDLEGIYRHRGSAFGKYAEPQPTQIDAENSLAITLLKHQSSQHNSLLLEDEAVNIGSRKLPDSLINAMKASPLVILETALQQRIENVYMEYIENDLLDYRQRFGHDNGFAAWKNNLLDSLGRISKRLGGVRYKKLLAIMENAIRQQSAGNSGEQHKDWIRLLLTEYYDPMYDYQLSRKSERVVFTGEPDDVLQYVMRQYSLG